MSTPADLGPNFRLRIDAHALVQLGEQLITDDEQALLELAKNSYDADADYAKIRVDTEYVPKPESDFAPAEAVGLIEIEDNGCGMNAEGIREGWLMISLSLKREQKRNQEPSPKYKRFPLGDKGLGRLGTMKLGKCLSVETRNSPTDEGWLVIFQWSDIRSGAPLETVPIRWKRVPANGKTGTTVRVFGLRDRFEWKKDRRQKRIQASLSGLLSPFQLVNSFEVSIAINGEALPIARISTQLRQTATVTINYDWDGKRLHLDAKIKLVWFRKKRVEFYNTYIAKDRGAALFESLRALPGLSKEFQLETVRDGPWYLSAAQDIKSADLFAHDPEEADPGPFSGSLDYFDLDADVELPQDVFDSVREYTRLVKRLANIYVYRDGFGIRMPNDWLELGSYWTSGRGFYSLKPSNVIGFFNLSVAHIRAVMRCT